MSKLLMAFLILFPTISMACSSNFDCDIGSKCVKSSGSYSDGICVGGMSPGNSNDRRPAYNPSNKDGTYGDTCSSNFDCELGSVCVKEGRRTYGDGTCMKR